MALQSISTPPPATAEVIVNENFIAVEPASLFGRKGSTTTGLTWGYYGGRLAGTSIADGTVTLSNATNRVVAVRTTGVVSTSTGTTNWNDTANYARLYQVVASGGAVTSYEDHRLGTGGILSAGSLGRQSIWVPARNMSPSATGGCAPLATIATSANRPDAQTLDFDSVIEEYAQFSVAMPKRWNLGTVTFKPVWSHAATAVNFTVVWGLLAVALSNDDLLTTAYGTTQTSTDTGGTTNDLYVGPESAAITIANTPAAEDVVFFRVSRYLTDISDTMMIDARLHGIILYVDTTAENDE